MGLEFRPWIEIVKMKMIDLNGHFYRHVSLFQVLIRKIWYKYILVGVMLFRFGKQKWLGGDIGCLFWAKFFNRIKRKDGVSLHMGALVMFGESKIVAFARAQIYFRPKVQK